MIWFFRLGTVLALMIAPVLGQAPASPAPSTAARIAVISTSETANLAALVTTELSQDSGIALLDRDEMAKVGDELKLQQLAGQDAIALGKLMGTDGLIFISKGPEGLQVRFTAVGLGFALFDDPIKADASLPLEAKSLMHQIESYIPKLKLSPSQAIPISVLNLHVDYASNGTAELDLKLTLLLESSLTAIPEYVVLERRHGSALGFEHSLAAAPQPLLQGVYVVDGRVSPPVQSSSDVIVHLRLRTPDNRMLPSDIHGSLDDLHGLVEKMTAEIRKATGTTSVSPTWQPQDEAREYLREGLWAWHNGHPQTALEALDSAELLGETAPDLLFVRAMVLCDLGGDVRYLNSSFSGVQWMDRHYEGVANVRMPDDVRADDRAAKMLQAIDETNRYKTGHLNRQVKILRYIPIPHEASGFSEGDPQQLENQVLFASSKVLLLLDQLHHPRADELRQAIRALSGFDPLHQPEPCSAAFALEYADEWSLSPEETLAYYHACCATVADPKFNAFHDLLFKTGPVDFCPHFAKTPTDQRALFNQFIDGLIADPKTKPIGLWFRFNWAEPAEKVAAYHAFLDELWTQRERLLSAHQLASYLNIVGNIQDDLSTPVPPVFISLLHYLLQQSQGDSLYGISWWPSLFPPEEAPAFWKELQDYKERSLSRITIEELRARELKEFATLESDYIQRFGNPSGPVAPTATAPGLRVPRYWNSSQALSTVPIVLGDLEIACGSGGVIWAYSVDPRAVIYHPDGSNSPKQAALFKISLPDLKTEGSVIPWPVVPTDIQVDSDYVYIIGQTSVSPGKTFINRFQISSQKWERHEFNTTFNELIFLDGKIYFSLGKGAAYHDWDQNQTVFLEQKPENWPKEIRGGVFSGIPSEPKFGLFPGWWKRNSSQPPPFDPRSKQGLWFSNGMKAVNQELSNGESPEAYGYRGDDVFVLSNRKLWWFQQDKVDPILIPLRPEIDDSTLAYLKPLYPEAILDMMKNPTRPGYAHLVTFVTDQGLCFYGDSSGGGGFWFLPYTDIDAYLKSVHP